MTIIRGHRLILLLTIFVIALPFYSFKVNADSKEDGDEEIEEVNSVSEKVDLLSTIEENEGAENKPEESSNTEDSIEDAKLEQKEPDNAADEETTQEEKKLDEKTTNKKTSKSESEERSNEQQLDTQGDVEEGKDSSKPIAIRTSGYYNTDQNAIVVPTELVGQSTNAHTKPQLLWADGDKVLVAIKSTHELQYMTLNRVRHISSVEYGERVPIYVDNEEFKPDGLQGNKKDSRWTIFTFNMADLKLGEDSTYSFFVKGIGGGHDLGGTLKFDIPKEDVTAQKAWNGGTERPTITLQLMAQVGNEEKKVLRTGEVNGSETSVWTYKWSAVPKYDPYGRQYTFTADELTIPINYEKSINGLVVTNTYNPQKIDVGVNKKWIGPAADSVTVKLFANERNTAKSRELNEENNWSGSFTGLNKFDDKTGEQINYSVEEVQINGFTSERSGSVAKSFTFTNTNNAILDITVSKKWVGPKTESIKIILLANGNNTKETLTLSDDNNWSAVFKDLRKFDATTGKVISYTVEEVDKPKNYDVKIIKEGNNFIVTNTANRGSLKLEKVDAEGKPMAGATFRLIDSKGNVIDTLTTGEDGTIQFERLEWGDYTLKETKAPEGYNKLIRQIPITINGDHLHETEQIVNKPIAWQLPATGGFGTIGFYGIGFMLMVFALWTVYRKKQT